MKRKKKRLISILLVVITIIQSLIYIPDRVYAADSVVFQDKSGRIGGLNNYYSLANGNSFGCRGCYDIKGYPSIQTSYSNGGYELYINNTNLLESYEYSMVSLGNYCKVIFKVNNPTSVVQSFTLGTGCDIALAGVDSTPLNILSDDNGYKGFAMTAGGATYNVLVRRTYGVTDVTRLWCGSYYNRKQCYTGSEQATEYSGDSGFAIAWDDTINPGETKTYSYLIGYGVVNDPPVLSIASCTSNWYYNSTASIAGTFKDKDAADSVSVRYSIDDGVDQELVAGRVTNNTDQSFNTTINVPSLTAGQHTLTIFAMDEHGNMSTPYTTTFNYFDGYTITYNANGGTGAPSSQTKIHGVSLTLSSTQPTRTGYTFKGWSTSLTATVATYQAGGTYTANADATLYAVWQRNNYTLDCNSVLNGVESSTGHSESTFSVDITDPIDSGNDTVYDQSNIVDYCKSLPYGVNYKITLNNVTGYSPAQNPITGTLGASNTVVKPTWTANTYTISYDLNDISDNSNPSYGTNHPTTATYNSSFTVNNPTMTGYTFTGWTITGMDSVTHTYGSNNTTNTSISSTKVTSFKNLRSTAGTVTFKANWTPNTYKLEIDPNGSMSSIWNTTGVYSPTDASGTPLIFDSSNWYSINIASRIGYDLTGYFDAATGGTKVYHNNGNCVGGTAYFDTSNRYKNASNLKVYAQWTPRTDTKFKVNRYTMNTDGSTFTFYNSNEYTGTSDSTITLSNYVNAISQFTYIGGKGTTLATNIKPASFDTTTTILQDGTRVINLYYSRNKHTLTINPNGGVYNGSTSTTTKDMYYNSALTINNPTRAGATFLGWLITGSGSTIVDNNNGTSTITMGTANTTITAKWSLQPVFTPTDTGTFYEGQTINYNDLMYLVTCKDSDYSGADSNTVYSLKSLTYKTGETLTPSTDFMLDTSSQKIGQLTLVYSAIDRIPDTSNNSNTTPQYVEITYTKTCSITYNDLPQLDLQSFFYADKSDTRFSRGTIEGLLVSFAKASDKQDSIDNIPWWSKGPSTSVRSGHNTNTLSTLQNNIKTTGISNIILNTAYLRENPTAQSDINQQIKTAEQLGNLYDTNKTLFNAIYSLEVTYDTKDQFGKYASGKIAPVASVKGVTNNLAVDKVQSASDRTITILFTDGSLGEQMESERYIETVYEGSLVKNSFWGNFEYGRNKLLEILGLRDNKDTQASTKYTEHSNNINITINDYDTLNK